MNKNKSERGQAWLGVLVAVLVVLVLLAFGIRTTQPGQIRLVKSGGRLTGRIMTPGWGWIAPFVNSTEKFDTRWQVYETSAHPESSQANYPDYPITKARSSDGQYLILSTSTRFRISASCATEVLNQYGTLRDAVEKIVKYSIRSNARSVTSSFVVEDFNTYDTLRLYEQSVQNILNEIGKASCVEFADFVLRGVDYDPDYAAAIERQQIAEEDIETAMFRAQEAEQIAQAAIEEAKGRAESARIEAEGEAKAIELVAQAQANAIRLTGQSLDNYPSALQWEFIQKLKGVDWGVVPFDTDLLITP